MKKRFLSLFCVLALCLGLLPTTALAVDAPATLYVGNNQVIVAETVTYWSTNDSGELTRVENATDASKDWTVRYNPNTATLTLNEAKISGSYDQYNNPFTAGIYAKGSSDQPVALTIELIGTNTITGAYGIFLDAETNTSSYGTNATLTITDESNGSLKVSGSSSYGIFVKSGTGNASLTIKNASVDATSSVSYSSYAGVCVGSSDSATTPALSLAVNGGSLTANGGENSVGIQFDVASSQANNATTSLTVDNNAIVKAINGIGVSRVHQPIPSGIGIVFDDKEGTVYGDVTLDESLTINQGETMTVPDGSSLNCNGNLTNNGTILASGGTVSGNLSDGSTVTTPSISQQPTGQTVTEGQGATFTVEASAGSETPTYHWQQKTAASGSDWTDISQETSASYTISSTTTSMSGNQYRCVVKSASGVSVISQAATLTVETYTPPTTYTIRADVTPAGSGSVSGGGSYTEGTSVTLTATNNPGYRFVGWVDQSGQSVSSDNPFTFVATSDSTLTAKFEQVYTVTVSSTEGGTATGGGTYAKGDTVTLTATPNSGYRFVGWLESGTTVSTNTNYTFVANSDRSLTAQFDRISSGGGDSDPTYSITLPSRVTGGELKLSRRYAEKGETVTLTAIPDEGYELNTLTVTDSKGKEIDLTHKGGNEYTFKMPAGRVEIEVSFREIEVELPFTDVPEGAWYEDAAAYVYKHGLMAGTSATTFAPEVTTSRAMIATILWRMAGSPVVNYAMNYTDVAQGQWCSEAIRWATSEGVVTGYGNGLFGTNDPITREQLATMLWRYAQTEGYDVSIGEDTNILSYTDVANLSEYAIPAMQWAVGAGIINGTGDGSTLTPQGQATRAQAAVMLQRFCEKYVIW